MNALLQGLLNGLSAKGSIRRLLLRVQNRLATRWRQEEAGTIPLIIPNFDQLFCLINLINWWNYYTKDQPVYVVDNASEYRPLLDFYGQCGRGVFRNVRVVRYPRNACGDNLTHFLRCMRHEYYVLSNPDIAPCFDVPENFLDVYRHCIDDEHFHHVGFNLNIDAIPEYIKDRESIVRWEMSLRKGGKCFDFGGARYDGILAPIDLTFAMYARAKGGWAFPHNEADWNNSLRLFNAEHIGWYIHPQTRIEENINYFTKCIHKTAGVENGPGVNNYNPYKSIPEAYTGHAS